MLWSVALLPLLLAPLVYLAGRRVGRAGLTLGTALITLATLALAGLAVANDWSGGYRWSDTLALTLDLSTASAVFALVVPLVALPVIVYAGYHESSARLMALLVAFVGAMQWLVLAGDLLTLLIAWELVGACSWALISHRWGKAEIPRDAAQAFLVTRFGDLGLYIAAAAVFAGSGGFGYTDLAALEGGLLHVAAGGIVLAAAAKSAQVPFSPWLFAAMSGPVPVSSLLHSATMVAAGLYLIIRLQPTLSDVGWFAPLAMGIGLVTALAGGVVGAAQGHAKKLLAASSSAQYGLMWLAVGAGFPGVALLHFVAHAFMKAGLFLSAGLAESQVGSYRLEDMRLGRQLPGIALATGVASLALAGLAPLGAAWSKEQIVATANHQALWLALLVMLAGGLSALYATRFQLLAFGRMSRSTREVRSDRFAAPSPSPSEAWALYSLVGMTLLLSLWWWPEAQHWMVEALGLRLPESHPWELVVSLVLVLTGIVLGIALTRRERSSASSRWKSVATGWFGLPTLIEGLATLVVGTSARLARFDDHGLDAFVHAAVMRVRSASGRLARFDDGVVDAGLHRAARLGQWLARCNATRGEVLAEGVPGSLSRLTDWGGRYARQVQSGQMHHYYAGIAMGLAAIMVLLGIGVFL
ncbi:NADH-quinone oxidoreductase subunit L [Halomonas korlensis]|uniref:NADH:ubiquinone oxidoreductase subunit 5 (Chain L)/Multisubunit Na+/H+ antiporter, MnhA subunit n=1 Tax=Halomonas korlensis TaxID=463301 RepID=A0A1I7H7T5_9GAMM|nr:proton-conducting transporter membrane subunit [Halomonas korlensis]SFU56750.1 NADH:ubiquinone oxidoreductase subunit 5 (chain L)/Multisubunit Na+/H+ antiporter, MnhA subunit [Halomonas korlensis]